jgi:hypothetical protein
MEVGDLAGDGVHRPERRIVPAAAAVIGSDEALLDLQADEIRNAVIVIRDVLANLVEDSALFDGGWRRRRNVDLGLFDDRRFRPLDCCCSLLKGFHGQRTGAVGLQIFDHRDVEFIGQSDGSEREGQLFVGALLLLDQLYLALDELDQLLDGDGLLAHRQKRGGQEADQNAAIHSTIFPRARESAL